MRTIKFNCPQCGGKIAADEDLAGGIAQCPHCDNTVVIPESVVSPGTNIAGFKLVHRLGVGGMGEVWLANQITLDRKVALKLLAPEFTENEQFINRFLQEAKMSGKLTHPNIVATFDAGVDYGMYYLAMSYIEGEELDRRLKRLGVMPEKEALRIVRCVADALLYAWNKFKLLHRDIKPSNIMLDRDDKPLLMDMGISKTLGPERDVTLTMEGQFVGTPHYISPEQAQADPDVDFRTDIYALGATLYHLSTGDVPYDADAAVAILTKHITEPFPPPQERNPNLSNQCSALLEIMMAKKKHYRQKSWENMIRDIHLVMDNKFPMTPLPPGQRKVIKVARASPPVRHHNQKTPKPSWYNSDYISPVKLMTALVVLFLLLFVLGLIIFDMVKESRKKLPNKMAFNVAEYPLLPKNGESTSVKPPKIANGNREDESLNEKQAQDMLDYAVTEASKLLKTDKQFDDAINRFRKIIERWPGTRYELMSEDEIVKLNDRKAADQVLRKLDSQARKLVEKGQYREAAKIYMQYKKAYAEVIREECHIKARTLLSRAMEQDQDQKAQEDTNQARMDKAKRLSDHMLQELSVMLLREQYKDAYAVYNESEARIALKDLEPVLKDLTSIPTILLENLRSSIGQREEVELKDGIFRLRILEVRDDGMVIASQRKVRGGDIGMNFRVRDMVFEEKLEWLEGMHEDAVNILRGREKLRHKDYAKAKMYFLKCGVLAQPMAQAMKQVQHDD